jgi:hypothetical protein
MNTQCEAGASDPGITTGLDGKLWLDGKTLDDKYHVYSLVFEFHAVSYGVVNVGGKKVLTFEITDETNEISESGTELGTYE